MIGPGWMPSRPRPLPRARRGLWSYTPGYLRRRRARRRPASEPTTRASDDGLDGFDGGHAALPVATLRPSRSAPRHRVIGDQLVRWFATRWAWLRPRAVPLIVATAGMFAVLGATRYLSALARGDGVVIEPHKHCVRLHSARPAPPHLVPAVPVRSAPAQVGPVGDDAHR